MQKKLVTLAAAGLVSSTAFAQSNVTIYGVVDASIDITDNGDTTAGANGIRANKISSNSSRIGFKGSEDLGDGLKALFQLETAFNADGTATTSLNSRNTFVGLASNSWGQVLLGQYDTPYKTSTRYLDVFADHLADTRNLLGRSRASGVAFDQRPANTVRYDSPDINGLKLAAAYVAGAEAATTSGQTNGSAWSLSGTYVFNIEQEWGWQAWSLIGAYERHKFGTAATGTLAAAAPVLTDQTEKAWKLGVGYKSGAWRAGFAYEKVTDDFTAAVATGEHKAWTLAGGYTAGSNEFKAAYTLVDDYKTIANSGARQWAIGVDHILSKRTKLYAEYVKLDNDTAGIYSLNGAGSNSTGTVTVGSTRAGADPSAFSFGVRHTY